MGVRRHCVRNLQSFLPVLVLLCSIVPAIAADVSLAWDPSISTNISGYKVYVGSSSGTYNAPIAIGNQTTYTVTGLADGAWYFAVTAFDVDGNESDFSNEVFQTIGASTTTCDVNGDSSINVLDLQALTNIILGINPGSGNLDLNQDGRVDVMDLQILSNIVLGLRSCP